MPSESPQEVNSAYALERLRTFLTEADLASGSRLPTERQLAETFGVGRRALRRALDALEAEGLLWRRQGAGTFLGERDVASLSPSALIATTDFAEIMEVRLRIEPALAQMAALRARPDEVERMRDLAERISASEDADARELWDGMLHRLIAQAARNTLFLGLFDIVNRIRQDAAWCAIREQARISAGSRAITIMQHTAIVDAIGARDPASAGRAMHEHLLLLQDTLNRQTSHYPDQSPDVPAPPPIQQGNLT
ncbi:FadR/GntR family transcriptional regulator [Falsirhodobacter algicola]|uniref:FCD domain-containing protein n=1 Tax=Falsirhodobacter algicola TaxID=2692330 RepID=A0A8J8SLV6_9RHOB|nr:FCD domain-containing protein [Falsirhodobacter algicola]QUS36776.1 FCD domain-containing protein [Falsirhodobacter algicola]